MFLDRGVGGLGGQGAQSLNSPLAPLLAQKFPSANTLSMAYCSSASARSFRAGRVPSPAGSTAFLPQPACRRRAVASGGRCAETLPGLGRRRRRIRCSAVLSFLKICSGVCLVRFIVQSPPQFGRMSTLIHTGPISRLHVIITVQSTPCANGKSEIL